MKKAEIIFFLKQRINSWVISILIFFFLFFCKVNEAKAQDTLTLQQAIEIGLRNNFSISIAKNEAQIAKNNNTIGNAGFLPQVNVNAAQTNSIQNTKQQFFSGETTEKEGAESSVLNAGVSLDWTLFDGFYMFINKSRLRELEELGELNSRIQIETTMAQIIMMYCDIVQQQRKRIVIQDAIALSKERKRIAEEKFKLGVGSQLDLLQATVDLNADSSTSLRQEMLLASTKADFNKLLARTPDTSFYAGASFTITENLVYADLLKKGLEQNPELYLAKKNVYLSSLDVREVNAQRYPRIGVNVGYNFSQSEAEVGVLKSNRNYGLSYGLTATLSLFNGFNITRNFKNAKLAYSSSELQYKETEMEITSGLYKTFNTYNSGLKLIDLEINNLDAARQNVTVALEKYRLGTINAIELREAQQNLINAQDRLLIAQYETKLAEVELLQLTGTILQ